MNQPKQFALTALAILALTVAIGLLAAPRQDAAAIVYIMIAVVVPVPVAYFLVYLDGFGRLNPSGGSNTSDDYGQDSDRDHDSDRDRRHDRGGNDADEGDAEPTQ